MTEFMRVLAPVLALAALAAPPFELPPPTGPHAVGTTSWTLTDQARTEPFAPGERRQVKVVAWYPTDVRQGVRAPYLREGVDEARVFAAVIRARAGSFDAIADVETHAIIDAAPLRSGGPLPVVVFAAGYGGVSSAHASLVEDLASHGFAVLTIAHPYEAAFVRLEGRSASMLDDSGESRSLYLEVIGEWGREDETMAAVTAALDREEQRRLLRGYLAAIPKTTSALQRWVDDTKLVLDRLPSLPARAPSGRLAARLNVRGVGVGGHSMGGVTAADFCVADRRCHAALNLDGIPQYGSMIDHVMPASMLMVYSARPGRLGASDAIYSHSASKYYRVDVKNTRHLDFSDLNFWGGRLREVPLLGGIEPARAAAVTRAIVREYFDQELRGRKSSLLAHQTTMPEVTVIP